MFSAKIHAGNFAVSHDLDLWPSGPKINGFPGLVVAHFNVKFVDPICIGFWDIVQNNKQTDRQTHKRHSKPHPSDYRQYG